MTTEEQIIESKVNAAHVTLSLLAVAVIALVAYQFAIIYKEGRPHGSDDDNAPVSLDKYAG